MCEAIKMPGKGAIQLTGLLGEVMKESARIAISYLKSRHQAFKIPAKDFSLWDIHVHFPSGAVPKDGPSAGVALATTLASLFTGRPVRHDIAMTGEITLLGKVLPIGGLKEKILAAKRAGITKLVLPEENQESLSDFPKDILEGMDIRFVKRIEEVLDLVLVPAKASKAKSEAAKQAENG